MGRPTFRNHKTSDPGEEGNASVSTGRKETYNAGDVRQSQLITTFGVGAMVDYVSDTVIIAGIDSWKTDDAEERKIYNENLSALTDKAFFLKPPCGIKRKAFKKNDDKPSFVFPEKLYCPSCRRIFDVHGMPSGADRNKCPECRHPLTPSRFVLICANGHMEDFPYDWWVHRGRKCRSGLAAPRLTMYNQNNRADMESLTVKCLECGEERRIVAAFGKDGMAGYKCSSRYPHLYDPDYFSGSGCNEPVRAVHRTSQAVYSPIVMSALSIPPWSREAVKVIGENYEMLKMIPDQNLLDAIRLKLPPASKTLRDDELKRSWEQIRLRREDHIARQEDAILRDEYNVMCQGDNNDPGDREFASYNGNVPERYRKFFEQIVIVDRLTEVQALTGFRRGGMLGKKVRLSGRSREWYPAVELVGEGIFIRFDPGKIKGWLGRVSDRYEEMRRRLNKTMLHIQPSAEKFSAQYVLLHTFSHLLIREISAVCGYNAASLKEKIYSTYRSAPDCEMAGVLIYVSSTDCDSSLGGLIGTADNSELFGRILDSMLDKALWCSADPLCIGSRAQGTMSLNYSACHNCTLLPETSCEFFNSCLDRAAVVGTPEERETGFFYEMIGSKVEVLS